MDNRQRAEGEARDCAGELRNREVAVGRHLPPTFSALAAFLARFATAYGPARLGQVQRVIAAAASHHRLAWLHPFLDGDGRVTRLFTHAYLIKAGVDGHRLWMVSRGFARRRDDYLWPRLWLQTHLESLMLMAEAISPTKD